MRRCDRSPGVLRPIGPKISPESVARQAFDAVEGGGIEVLADERSRFVKASLARGHELIYGPLQQIFFPSAKGSCPASWSGRLRPAVLQVRATCSRRRWEVARLERRRLGSGLRRMGW
jgi:hypothetical protein